MNEAVQVLRDAEALRTIAQPGFQAEWVALLDQCPWGTSLQSPAFVGTWYACYADRYQPLILARSGADGQLDGLMALAVERASGQLTFAGAHQAEYHTWLARPGAQTFIVQALDELRDRGFPSLTFTYLPPGAPLDWLDERWGARTTVRVAKKPLMDIGDGADVRESLRKKSNKSRLNRLQRIGPLEFVQVTTPEELDRDYDDIILFTDVRHGAIHDTRPFQGDPHKRRFFRELMKHPDLMHVTVMRVGGKAVSAHIGFRSRSEVMVGIIAHSPFLAEHSPGKLHILQLAQLLQQQGIAALDLTPGNDSYKDRSATRYEEAHAVTVFLNTGAWTRQRLSTGATGMAKRTAAALGIDKPTAERYGSLLGRIARHPARSARSAVRIATERARSTREMRFYRLAADQIPPDDGQGPVRADALDDLLCFKDGDPATLSMQQFLSNAMYRIEAGSHVYTCVRDGRLVHYGWMTPRVTRSFVTEVQHDYDYPENSAVLWDFHTVASARGQGLYSRALRRMLADAKAIQGTAFVYISVLADNLASRRVIEKTGFQYQGSIIRNSRGGTVTHTIVAAPGA